MAERKDQPTDGIRQVIEAEIIDPDYHANDHAHEGKEQTSFSGRKVVYTSQGPIYAGIFTSDAFSRGGCLAQLIPCGLFLYCLGEYGFFPALGFAVFCLIGSVMGTLRAGRSLMAGQLFNPWVWRVGNWIVCFLLTVLLAGGFND